MERHPIKSPCLPLILICTVSLAYAEAPLTDRERELLDRIERLERRIAALETAAGVPAAQRVSAPAPQPAGTPAAPDKDSPALAGFLSGTTLNIGVDGFYEYNFNRPVGRTNLLRAYDTLDNNLTLNQALVMVERAPDLSAGRRFGLRIDLMFGQPTDTSQTEPRPQFYRNIFQAYGTYVFPLGKGLTVDFGKWTSSLGIEGTFTKDQINYTRSLLFTALPLYHLGFRSTYNFSDKVSVTHWLVNGLNQSEDFNGFKSNALLVALKPAKNVSWNLNYYEGREQRDLFPDPVSGLPTVLVTPTPRGRFHIFDSYVAINAGPKVTLAAEGDYFVNRYQPDSPASTLAGGAAYLKYQFLPQFSLAGRFEYLADRGGILSGVNQALKEATFTATWQPGDGFQVRSEFRRDFSNLPFFLSDRANVLAKQQNTALLGMTWWFGGKQGSW